LRLCVPRDVPQVLSVQQLYRISTMYWDDRYGTETVSQEVLGLMKQLMMQDTNSAVSNSFLLDDDSSIPFSVEAISTAMKDTNIPSLLNNASFPQPLLKHPSFAFLTDKMADATASGGAGSVGA
jgi:myosin-5